MKKALIVSTVSRQFYLFEQGNIELLRALGYEVHAAANYGDINDRLDNLDIIRHHCEIERSPFSLKNIKAYQQLKRLMKSENFDIVHCHSPMGGVLARLAAKSVGVPTVIYTAHGFHFYKGAPKINWLLYYPIEKLLSKYTDILITINQEDFNRANQFNTSKVKYVPGVGVDSKKINLLTIDRDQKRKELKLPKDGLVILSVGELNKNKNHEVIIKGLAEVKDPNIFYIVCGKGDKEDYLKELVKSLNLTDRIKFLGFRNDVIEIYSVADIFAFPSYREGLSVSLMEAMAAGLPIVCSNIRGNVDLIEDGKGGYLINPSDVDGVANALTNLNNNLDLRCDFGLYNSRKVIEYSKENVIREMSEIYSEVSVNDH
jgi:glycosyltransferase involved in cell wall biosynthesis